MLKILFIKSWAALFFISGIIYAQKPYQVLFSEVHSVPGDSGLSLYYSYKIPYSSIVFEKTGSTYSGSFSINIEVTDSAKKFITRQISEKTVSAKDFEETTSREIFHEGVIRFDVPELGYFLNPVFSDINSGREINLEPVFVQLNRKKYLKTLIVNAGKLNCEDGKFYPLSSFGGDVPFTETEQEFLIPSDTSVQELYAVAVNNEDTIFSGKAEDARISYSELFECGGKIFLREDSHGKYKLFSLKNLGGKLYEGILTIFVSEKPLIKETKTERVYNGRVSWYNKPFSLFDPERAIKMLKYMESDSAVASMLAADEDDYQEVLFNYWEKSDPTPGTAFNPLMLEYYTRVDYAERNFSTISGMRGIDSDRGMVFIKFGKPTEVERTSDEYGKVVETWSYRKIGRKFVFVDRQGTGEFLLRNG